MPRRNEPVRLIGTAAEVTAVAGHAWRVVAVDQDLAQRLLPALVGLGRSARADPSRRPVSRGAVWWAVALGVGLLGAVVSIAVMAPPFKGAGDGIDPSVPLVAVPLAIAVVALAIAVLLARRGGTEFAAEAIAFAVVVGVLVVGMAIYRLVVGTGGKAPVGAAQLAIWLLGVTLILVELALTVVRLRSHAGGAADAARFQVYRRHVQQRRQDAIRLAATRWDDDGTGAARWRDALRQVPDLSHTTAAQARQLGPVAWLAWALYDGQIEVSTVIPGGIGG